MRIIIFAIITFVLTQVSFAQSEQIHKYLSFIESDSPNAEVMWGTALLYHSLSSKDKEYLLENLSDEDLSYALKNYSSSQSMLKIGEKTNTEHLLLTYLLNEESVEKRVEVFERFYSKPSQNESLKFINKKVVYESTLGDEFYSYNPDPFTLFLLGNYNRTVNVTDRTFFEYIVKQKSEILSFSDTDLLNELYLAAYFNALYILNKFDNITEIYDQLLKLEFYPISYDKRNLFWSLDYVMYSLGYLDRSLEIQREFSLPLSDYLGDAGGVHAIYSSHGGYLYMLGKYREAREVFESTLNRAANLSDQNLTRLYNNLSLVYFMTGESTKYVETQLKALEHAESYENYDHQISIFRNLHIFYRKNQNYEWANLYIDRAANLAEEIDNRQDLISILISKSVFESSYMGDTKKADTYLKRAENLVTEDISSRYIIRILSERAELLKTQSLYVESIENLKTVSELALSQNNTSYFLESLVKISELNFQLGNYSEAASLLRNFRTHDISMVDFSILTLSRMLRAKLHHHNGEFIRAEELFKETTAMVLERARYSADHETGYWTIEREYMQLFEAYADFLMDRNQFEDAVLLLDRIKTINDASLLQNPLITSTQLTEEQLSRDRQITREMESLRRKLFTTTGNKRLRINNQLERLQAQKRELFQYQRALVVEQKEIPIWSIRRSLGRDQVLLHITSINESYYISKISRNKTELQKIEITESHKDVFESAIQGMITGRTDLKKLYEIGEILNLHEIAELYSSLILMPDGYLHQLPLDVIPITEPKSQYSYGATTFLIEKMDIRTLNRLNDIREQRKTREFEYDFTGFGVADFQNTATNRSLISLPQAPGEVKIVSDNLERFPKRAFFLEADATPQRFKEIAGKSRILHMATHSEISESDPLFSRLHLMPDPDSNDPVNQIFAYELFELDLQNELIMLNSCESGGDRAIQGSGIMGLSRALNYAGAKSLVLNAWAVNDQFAADFAKTFYQYINAGETKSRALQLTKIDFIQNRNANPHFWGPYILNGNNQPLIPKRDVNIANWLIALIFIAGFIVVSRNRKNTSF